MAFLYKCERTDIIRFRSRVLPIIPYWFYSRPPLLSRILVSTIAPLLPSAQEAGDKNLGLEYRHGIICIMSKYFDEIINLGTSILIQLIFWTIFGLLNTSTLTCGMDVCSSLFAFIIWQFFVTNLITLFAATLFPAVIIFFYRRHRGRQS